MSHMLRANQQVLSYLTPEALETMAQLIRNGVDADLALALVETSMTEDEIYNLPPKDEVTYGE